MDAFWNANSSQSEQDLMRSPKKRSHPERRPSLLPAFESIPSPTQANSLKRKLGHDTSSRPYYPTPVPTSSTGILPSSPARRPALNRTVSCCSERAPLTSMQTVDLPENGDLVMIGRSSNSCHFQLPYNRLISRVHVSVKYEAGDHPDVPPRIVIECLGWNGCIIHCDGRVHHLAKGELYFSTRPFASVILDVHDSRVSLTWPRSNQDLDHTTDSEEGWREDLSPESPCHRPMDDLPSSPPPPLQSPLSPSPIRPPPRLLASALLPSPSNSSVKIYEDPVSERTSESPSRGAAVSQSFDTVKLGDSFAPLQSFLAANLENIEEQENEDNENEENDPIVHSFGPFGANILDRLEKLNSTSFSTVGPLGSPERPLKRKKPLSETSNSPQLTARTLQPSPSKSPFKSIEKSPSKVISPIKLSTPSPAKVNESPIKNHVINQLAFSRVHAVPLSTIHSNLPAELRAIKTSAEGLTNTDLKRIIDATECVGEIQRSGKDAAGKPLENEYYYNPEGDDNAMRRSAVLGGRGGTGLRSVRKTHKQYYWKKPRV